MDSKKVGGEMHVTFSFSIQTHVHSTDHTHVWLGQLYIYTYEKQHFSLKSLVPYFLNFFVTNY